MTALSIASIRRDGGTQPRDHISTEIAKDYAEAQVDGAQFPPVVVFYDGTEYWLADGFHRVMAAEILNLPEISADVRQGDRRDAVLFSVGANADHGYRRSNLDKRRAVVTLLNDPEWSGWSDREIARRCCVEHHLVGSLRPKPVTGDKPSEPTRIYLDKHGNKSVMKIGGLAKRELPSVGGHIPDRKPGMDLPATGESGLASASIATGFDAKRLKALAVAGEIPGAEIDRGTVHFDNAKLKEWMDSPAAPPPPAVVEVPEEPALIPDMTDEQKDVVQRLLDLFGDFHRLGSASAALEAWGLWRGCDIAPDAIASAAAWMASFAAEFPETEIARLEGVEAMLRSIEANVVE